MCRVLHAFGHAKSLCLRASALTLSYYIKQSHPATYVLGSREYELSHTSGRGCMSPPDLQPGLVPVLSQDLFPLLALGSLRAISSTCTALRAAVAAASPEVWLQVARYVWAIRTGYSDRVALGQRLMLRRLQEHPARWPPSVYSR